MDIIDRYTNIPFTGLRSIEDLKVGMMVQIIEANDRPLRWTWYEVDEKLLILAAKSQKDVNSWIRMPQYGY